MNNIPLLRQDVHEGIDEVAAEIWILTSSPTTPYADNSLVYLRGRVIMPEQDITLENRDKFVIGVDAIFAQFLSPTLSILPTSFPLIGIRPEFSVFGLVLDIHQLEEGWLSLPILSLEEVGGNLEKTVFA